MIRTVRQCVRKENCCSSSAEWALAAAVFCVPFGTAFWGQVLIGTSLTCAFRGQVLSGTDVCCTSPYSGALREPRSRFPGACGDRDLSDLACLPAASLFEGLAPARVTERVRLPLAIRPGVDKPVHGQRTSSADLAACPHHAHSLLHTPAVNGVL